MTKEQSKVAFVFTVLCSAVGILYVAMRNIFPEIVIDKEAIYIIIIGSLPWLTFFFKEIRLPGGAGAVTHDRSQSVTEKPLPPQSNMTVQNTTGELSLYAKKIMATLWKYQKQHFKDDFSRRWTFTVHPQAQGFPNFLTGLAEMVQRGLVAVAPENQHCMLTNEGISYIQNNPELQSYSDLYTF